VTNLPPTLAPVDLTGYPSAYRDYPNVQPFSQRSALTYQQKLEAISAWIPRVLVPWIASNYQDLDNSWIDQANSLANTVQAALDSQRTEVETALTAQQQQVADNLAATLAQITAGENASLYDAQVYAALESANSTALALLDGRYATSTWQATIQALVDSGRLSQSALDADYLFTDSDLVAILQSVTSASRVFLDGQYKKTIQFRLSATAIQWQYVGDTVWTDLVQLADITGPSGPVGNPGGNAELAYAESTSNYTVPSDGVSNGTFTDVPGLNISFVMPSRPVNLEIQAVTQYNGASTLSSPYLNIIETTGGGSTVIAQMNAEKTPDNVSYAVCNLRKRITGTAGVTRTFKVQAVSRSNSTWKVQGNTQYPAFLAAYQC
jgi:hypothetical protein